MWSKKWYDENQSTHSTSADNCFIDRCRSAQVFVTASSWSCDLSQKSDFSVKIKEYYLIKKVFWQEAQFQTFLNLRLNYLLSHSQEKTC